MDLHDGNDYSCDSQLLIDSEFRCFIKLKSMKLLTRRKICVLFSHILVQFIVGVVSGSLLACQTKRKFNNDNQNAKHSLEMINESGNFLDEIRRLKRLALPKKSNLYKSPNSNELKEIMLLANALIVQDIKRVLFIANSLNYELVKFTDIPTQQILYGLREKVLPTRPLRGWGSYFINTSYKANALVEVPHILFDRLTEKIGAKVFLLSSARGFLLAGVHRNANGAETADVCNPIGSIFQEVHKSWVSSGNKTWQIHGFSLSSKPNFPAGTQSVLSDGRGTVSPEVSDLSQRMIEQGFQTFIYNKLSASAPQNRQLNQGLAGRTFSHLAGTHNVQGIYSHSMGIAFTHVELDESIRYNTANRDLVAEVIANSIQAVS